jgi:hypothetical protein
MPYGEVTLVPGVNVERTATLLKAGYNQSQLIRFKDSLGQKLGGWQRYYPNAVPGVPRDLHAWQDLNGTDHLSVGTTTQLAVITNNSYQDITPQTLTTNPAPNFTTSANSPVVTVTDPNISNVTVYDSVLFNTPIAVDGIILSGLYAITEITGTHSYEITAADSAVSGVTSQGVVPVFTTVSGSAVVEVALPLHGLSTGSTVVLPATTTGNGVTIQGAYTVASVVDANDFNITLPNQANASGSFSMNGGNAQFVYYINIGPPAVGSGYGIGGYGTGGYGTGTTSSAQTGMEITATDWTSDNWGEILLACPAGGGVYQFDPTGGFKNAGLVATAPPFNGGLFVSVSQQILFCWASTADHSLDAIPGLGIIQDPLLLKWSNVGDFTNFVPLTTDQAGDFRIGIGSKIVAGAAVQNQDLFWTDLDLWAANYQGQPFIFGLNRIGVGAGAISSHSVQSLRGNVYWMGPSNFYAYDANGVHVLPCSVWDFVFQNMTSNVAFQKNVRTLPNTPFNEAGWAFPSAASANGECDSYVKVNILEPNQPWDYGSLPRSAWIDQTVLGPPIGATPTGVIYQHETAPDADGQPLNASFTTGYFYIAEGEDYAFVDRIIPDFKWGTYAGAQGAQVQLSFNVVNYPGDAATVFGPFTVTAQTEYVSVRFRGALMSITVSSDDVGSFWRLGKVRYRYAPAGRR